MSRARCLSWFPAPHQFRIGQDSSAELRRAPPVECHDFGRGRRGVEVAGQQEGVAAGPNVPGDTIDLFPPARGIDAIPGGQVSDVEIDGCAVDAENRLDQDTRLATAGQRMDHRGDDVAPGEDGVSELTLAPLNALGEETAHSRAALQLFE